MAFIEIRRVNRPQAKLQDWSSVPRTIAIACWIFAAILGVLAGTMAYGQYQRMTKWTAAEGTVVHNEVYWDYSKNSKGGRSVVYGARFTMEYKVNGRQSVGVADLGYRSGMRSWIERKAKTLPVGTKRQVRVNPDNPSEVSLASDYGELSYGAAYFAFSLCLMILAIGFGMRWWSVHLAETRSRESAMKAIQG
jgi:hypothetical protein